MAAGVIAATLAPAGAHAQSPEEFWRRNNITLTIATAVGGGYDQYSRLLARHLGRFVPGNPTVIPKNVPGGGGIVAANHLFSNAAKDGAEFAMVPASVIIAPLLGERSAKFDMLKFTWLGNMSKDVASCGVSAKSGIRHFDDLFTREATFAASGPGGILAQHPAALRNVLGAKFKPIMGYMGSNDARLAVERGEVDGSCGIVTYTYRQSWEAAARAGAFRILIQLGLEKAPVYGDAPNVYDYAKTPFQRDVLRLVFGQQMLGRPLLAPPGLAADRRDALRSAIEKTLRDPQFLADAEKAQMEINPSSVEDVVALLTEFNAFSPEIVEGARKAMGE